LLCATILSVSPTWILTSWDRFYETVSARNLRIEFVLLTFLWLLNYLKIQDYSRIKICPNPWQHEYWYLLFHIADMLASLEI
jgi:hypothetical protein